MLAEIETGLVRTIRESSLGKHLRQVDSLPDLDGDSLIGRFATDAPAAYVALWSFPVEDNGYARIKYGVALVARNSHSQQAARHGDPMVIGLHPMLDAAMSLLNGLRVDSARFQVVSCDIVSGETLYQRGVYAGVVQIQAEVALPPLLDESALADFLIFDAQYDVEPHAPRAEHEKWLAEPPDHATSAPDLTDQLDLRKPK